MPLTFEKKIVRMAALSAQSLEFMSQHTLSYLQEMGISTFQLLHPERLVGYTPSELILPESCQLLLVSPLCPEGNSAQLLKNILKTVNLTLEQAAHIYPAQFSSINHHQLTWIWFAGCPSQELQGVNLLHSDNLTEIDGDTQRKRALWQQIQGYK